METTLTLIANLLLVLKQLALVMHAANLWTLAAMTALVMKGKRARLYEFARARHTGKPGAETPSLAESLEDCGAGFFAPVSGSPGSGAVAPV